MMLSAFLTNKASFFSCLSNTRLFYSDYKNYALLVMCTKNKTISETGSINLLISADKASNFTDFLNITSL